MSVQPTRPPDVSHYFIHGFGFDPIRNDYKVLRILQSYRLFAQGDSDDDFSDNSDDDDFFCGSEVLIYSLKDKYWRKIKCFSFILCYPCPGVLANGALHWVVRKKNVSDSTSYIILAFDLGSEECRVIPQPNYDDIYFHMSLWALGDSLCILCHYLRHGVDIWVLKDYEMKTWCKLISITQPKPIEVFEYIKPLVYSKNGSEVLLELDYSKFIWYNLKKKTIRHANVSGLPKSFDTEVFFRSILDPSNLIQGRKEHSGQSNNFFQVAPKKLLSLIFSYLPIRTLLQAQCVCKTWYNLINDSEFIKMQFEVSNTCNTNSLLILRGEKLLSLDFQFLDKAVEIDRPCLCPQGWTHIVGSSNGLVCLSKDSDITLWNPWTGKYENLPHSNFHFHASASHCCFIHGFGYDPISNDYKVISILQQHKTLRGGSVHSSVQVYSLRSKSWGKIYQSPYIICYPCPGVLANGALHWVARENPELYSGSNILMAFDLGSEQCRVVAQPNYLDTDFHMSLALLRNNLCLLCHYPKQNVDIWMMTDYKAESWTKLFSLSQPKLINHFEYLKPLVYSNDGTEILLEQDNEKLLWYNLSKKTVKYLNVRGLPKSFEAVTCSGSLVRIGDAPKNDTNLNQQSVNKSQSSTDVVRNNLDDFLAKGFKLKL